MNYDRCRLGILCISVTVWSVFYAQGNIDQLDAARNAVSESTEIKFDLTQGVGQIKFGDQVDAVIEILGAPSKATVDILEYSQLGYSILLDEEKRVKGFACGSGCDPEKSLAKKFRGKTKEGLQMFSSKSEVLNIYGEPTRISTPSERMEVLYYRAKRKKMWMFVFEDNKLVNLQFTKHPSQY